MKTILRIVKYTAISIYAICGIMLLVFLVPKTGWKALNVATGSMTPAIPTGSLVIIHHVNIHSLRTGDVVTYINPYNTKETITHRITEVTHSGNILAFVTKGDANKAADKQILGGNVVGKVVFHAPKVGRVLSWVKRPLGLILLVIIPGLLIIIDEIRRMVQALSANNQPSRGSEIETRKSVELPTPELRFANSETRTAKKPSQTLDLRQGSKRPGPDGLVKSLVLIVLVIAIATGATRASLKSSASLTGNTIATAVTTAANHVLIARVFIGGGTGADVCPGLNSTASIVDSLGVNTIIITNNCKIRVTNDTHINIVNDNNQTSSSGDANNSGNNGGGSATSGDSSNSNSTSTTVTVDDGGNFNAGQWVELYNPTDVTISISGWKLSDNSAIVDTLPARNLRSHHAVFLRAAFFGGKIGDGLDGSGDQVVLKNKLGATVDALSWGSDVAVMNPALPMIPVGGVAERIDFTVDSDTAGDWEVVSP